MNSWLRAAIATGSIAAFSFVGCCDKQTRRVPRHYKFGEKYLFFPSTLTRSIPNRDSIAIPLSTEYIDGQFSDRDVQGRVSSQFYGFWLDLTNERGKPIRLLWPQAGYVDELGMSHTVYAQPRGALPDDREHLRVPPPELIGPGERARPTVVPIYKQYLVASGCRTLYPFSEPLVPTRLDDKNEEQMKGYVDDLARRQVPVKLLLPIEIDGVRYDYTFTFVLKERWADLPKQ